MIRQWRPAETAELVPAALATVIVNLKCDPALALELRAPLPVGSSRPPREQAALEHPSSTTVPSTTARASVMIDHSRELHPQHLAQPERAVVRQQLSLTSDKNGRDRPVIVFSLTRKRLASDPVPRPRSVER